MESESQVERESTITLWVMGLGVVALIASYWFGLWFFLGGALTLYWSVKHAFALAEAHRPPDLPQAFGERYEKPENWAKVKFWYRDLKRQETAREVDVKRLLPDGKFLGYCHLRKEARTFRFSGIDYDMEVVNRLTGESVPVWAWQKRLEGNWQNLPEKKGSILFVGFAKEKLEQLERVAADNGFTVRKKFTDTVDYACVGSEIDDKKRRASIEGSGVEVLDEAAFYTLSEAKP